MTAFLALALALQPDSPSPTIAVRPPNEIEFPATVHAKRFEGWIMPGYHAIV